MSYTPPAPAPQSSNNALRIILIIVVVLIFLCCLLFVCAFAAYKIFESQLPSILSGISSP